METSAPNLMLKKGREKPVRNRHPWIFSGSLAKASVDQPAPGDLVNVLASGGQWLAKAYYNPLSQIRCRILTWDPNEQIDRNFWQSRIERALAGRRSLQFEPDTNAYRLINAESDGLPGLIVDKYGEFLVIQCLTAGIDLRKELMVTILVEVETPAGILERSDSPVRRKEGLQPVVEMRYGEEPPEELVIQENGLHIAVNMAKGHKTGLYLDQRENRAIVCQPKHVYGRQLLNVFAYTGGFALNAAAAGAARIVNVEQSEELLKVAIENQQLNAHDRPLDEYVAGNAFEILRSYRDEGRQFDMVILDPPKFANRQSDVDAACRGYKHLNWLAMRLLRPQGLLASFSCSGLVSTSLFQKVLFAAAVDAERHVQIITSLGQPADHPILLTFPESSYLKGFLCRVS